MQSHHDVAPMPNGNVLVLAWERIEKSKMIDLGRDPENIIGDEVWSEQILEIKPIGQDAIEIVWEWHLSDHLIQDFDSTYMGFGEVSEHPELVNINFTPLNGIEIGFTPMALTTIWNWIKFLLALIGLTKSG